MKLLELLIEVFDTKYDVTYRQTDPNRKATEGDLNYVKKHISTFQAENHKLIIEIYQYPNDFYFVSYYPKLNKDFRRSAKDPNKYRVKLNFKQPTTVLSTVMHYLRDFADKHPEASFGFYGAPDYQNADAEFRIDNSKRFRTYLQMTHRFFSDYVIDKDETTSSIVLYSEDKLNEDPEYKVFTKKIVDKELQ